MLWEYVCGGLGSNFHIPLYIDLGELVRIVTVFSYLVELRTCIWGYIYIYILWLNGNSMMRLECVPALSLINFIIYMSDQDGLLNLPKKIYLQFSGILCWQIDLFTHLAYTSIGWFLVLKKFQNFSPAGVNMHICTAFTMLSYLLSLN